MPLASSMISPGIFRFAASRTSTFVVAILVVLASAAGAARADTELRIEVERKGELFTVHAFLFAPVPPRDAWAVLTDFEHMASFVPNLSESRVTNRAGERLTVAQKGVARFGVLKYPFESVREVELFPFESVRSRNVGGNVSRVDSTTRIVAFEGGTRISYYVEVVPGFWFPGIVGESFLKHEIREQFDAILREMLRRQQGGAAPA
jgi:hypothetical protein